MKKERIPAIMSDRYIKLYITGFGDGMIKDGNQEYGMSYTVHIFPGATHESIIFF